MRHSVHTDYSIRVLIYLAIFNEKLVTIEDIATAYAISKNHLTKVVHNLVKSGFVASIRGRNGGIKLARDPQDINISHVVLKAEEDFNMVECLNHENNQCIVSGFCRLTGIFSKALDAYIASLAKYTLSDLVKNPRPMRKILQQNANPKKRIINV